MPRPVLHREFSSCFLSGASNSLFLVTSRLLLRAGFLVRRTEHLLLLRQHRSQLGFAIRLLDRARSRPLHCNLSRLRAFGSCLLRIRDRRFLRRSVA